MDIFTRQKRSEIMAKVSSKDTKPEIIVRKFLFARGFRFRKNVKNLPENQTLFYVSIKQLFSLTVVFGMVILAKELVFQKIIIPFGKRK